MIFRKIYFLINVYFLITISSLDGQSAFEQGNADYIIPQPVALQSLLENSPSLLNPSTVRTYVFSAGADGSRNRGIAAAGVEAAPFFLFKTFNLSKYLSGRLIRVLLRTRLSFSAQVNPVNGFNGAIGFRWMAHDDADLRSDSTFQRQLSELGASIPKLQKQCSANTNEQMCYAEGFSRLKEEQQTIDSLREFLKNSRWNGSVFEFAFTALYNSDTNNPYSSRIQQYNIYLNAALPIKTIGQNIFGITSWLGRNNKFFSYQRAMSFIDRAAFGNPSYRYFGEIKYIISSILKPDCKLGLGAMLHLFNGLAIQGDLSLSILRGWKEREAHLVLSFGIPEII